MKKIIVIYVGGFNPPIISHFSLAQQIINNFKDVEKIIFIPTDNQTKKPYLIEKYHRYNMLKLACDKSEKFMVENVDFIENEYLKSIQKNENIKKLSEKHEIWFAMGTDNIKNLPNWKEAKEIVLNYKIIALERGNETLENILEKNKFLNKHKNSFIKCKNIIKIDLSSTIVREKIAKSENVKHLTTKEINNYIIENKLFHLKK